VDNRELTTPYARWLVRLIRPFPNFDLFFVKSLRQKAIQLLQLKPGDRVLDAGCGPGGSFPYLVEAVSASGEVVGIEISPEMAINASRRIEKNGWDNVRVIEGDVQTVQLDGNFDAILMMGAPDAYASPQALDNLLPRLTDGARVVIFGAKLLRSSDRLSALFRYTFSHLTFPSTPALDYKPWAMLEERIGQVEVREYFFGWMFLAWGSRKISAGIDGG
jgi:tRNA A58 N-methylase Trm61